MENFLNLFWLAIVASAFLTTPRRTTRSLLALGCVLGLLFPIISISDDLLLKDQNSFEETLGIVVDAVILLIALAAVARIEPIRRRRTLFAPIISSDPRSPPRG